MYQREYEERLRVGMVGAGSHTYRNLLPALHYLPVELVAICNRGEEKLRRTEREYHCNCYTSTTEMYEREELDAVIISVSPQMHPTLAIEALDRGLHVFMEKPPAMTVEEVEKMIAARKDRVVSVGFKKAYMPAAVKAREIAGSAKYGGVTSMLAVYPMNMPANGEAILEKREFTNWLGNGCHPISFLLSIGGKVGAVTTLCGSKGQGCVILEFENGIIGNLHLADGPHPIESYQLFAKKWNLTIDNTDTVILNRGIPFEYAYTDNFAPTGDESGAIVWKPQNCLATLENKSLYLQGMVPELECFCQAVMKGTDAGYTSLEFAREVMKVYEAALRSAGKRIDLKGEGTGYGSKENR